MKIIINKIVKCIVLIFIVLNSNAFAVANNLFSYLTFSDLEVDDKFLIDKYQKNNNKFKYQIVKINIFSENDNLILNIFDSCNVKASLINKQKYFKITTEFEDIFGTMVKKNNKVAGVIYYHNEIIEILPLVSDNHIICIRNRDSETIQNISNYIIDNINNSFDSIAQNSNRISSSSSSFTECKIRILVSYTFAASDLYGEENLNLQIESALSQLNEAYERSGVTHNVELACTIMSNYNESVDNSDISMASYYFRTNIRNDFDLEHNLRELFAADCMVLIGDFSGGACGIAEMVGNRGETHAYCAIKFSAGSSCLSAQNVLAHEIGHLAGCGGNWGGYEWFSPYTYGHGTCNSVDNWSTIMSSPYAIINNVYYYCSPKISNFSNPDISYNGVPTGDVTNCNNARVLNETETMVKEFRLTPISSPIPDHIVNEYNIADFLAHSTITTSQNFIAKENSEVTLRAGGTITLSNGFHAKNGSNFHAFIDNCGASVEEKASFSNHNTDQNSSLQYLYVYPNPSNSIIKIRYNLNTASVISLYLTDILGNKVKSIKINSSEFFGEHLSEIDVSELSNGIYQCILSSNSNVVTNQFVLIK